MKISRYIRTICAAAVIILTVTLCSPAEVSGASSDKTPSLSGTSAVLIDAGSGQVLYEKNAYEKRDPASITKMLNAMVVLDTVDMDKVVTIPEYSYETVGHVFGLKAGEKYTVKDLLYAMMLPSNNDVAEALALVAGGDIESFCAMMNDKAEACGGKDTNFTNPNGLNNAGQEKHRTTAMDLALIASEGMKNSTFREIVKTKSYTVTELNSGRERRVRSTNACLYDRKIKIDDKKVRLYYKGCNGIKTGLTSVAGNCFVGSARKGNTELIAVTLNCATAEEKFEDAIALWDYGFNNYRTYTAAKASEYVYELKVKKGNLAQVDLGIREDLDITVDRGSKPAETTETRAVLNSDEVNAPVKKGTVMGRLVCLDEEGNTLGERELIALENVEEGWALSAIGIADEEIPFFILVLALIISAVLIFLLTRRIRAERRRQRRRARRERAVRSRERERERNPFSDMNDRKGGRNV